MAPRSTVGSWEGEVILKLSVHPLVWQPSATKIASSGPVPASAPAVLPPVACATPTTPPATAPPARFTAVTPVGRATWTSAPREYTFGVAQGVAVGAHTACWAGRRRRISASGSDAVGPRLPRLLWNPTALVPFKSKAASDEVPKVSAEPAISTLPFTG